MEFKLNKKTKRQSVVFNPEQQQRVSELANEYGYLDDKGKPNINRTLHMAVMESARYRKIRADMIKSCKETIAEFNLTIPDLFDVTERKEIYASLTDKERKQFVTHSQKSSES